MKFLVIPCLFIAQLAIAQGPCAADKDKFCSGVEKGEGRIVKCLKDNEAQLSAECKAHRASMKESMKDIHAACEADVENLCANVEKGKGRIMKCLKENGDKVSEACKTELKDKMNMRKKMKLGN